MSLALPVGLLVAAVLCAIAMVGTLLDRWAAGHDAETTRGDESTHHS